MARLGVELYSIVEVYKKRPEIENGQNLYGTKWLKTKLKNMGILFTLQKSISDQM